jgi:hypothetical protein
MNWNDFRKEQSREKAERESTREKMRESKNICERCVLVLEWIILSFKKSVKRKSFSEDIKSS